MKDKEKQRHNRRKNLQQSQVAMHNGSDHRANSTLRKPNWEQAQQAQQVTAAESLTARKQQYY